MEHISQTCTKNVPRMSGMSGMSIKLELLSFNDDSSMSNNVFSTIQLQYHHG